MTCVPQEDLPRTTRISVERAEQLVVRTVALARRSPGPRGGFTNQHLAELRLALADYLTARCPGRLTADLAERLADHAVVVVQAPEHAHLRVRPRCVHPDDEDGALAQRLMEAACNAYLDALLLGRSPQHESGTGTRTDEEVCDEAFGRDVTPDQVRALLRCLVRVRRPAEVRVLQAFLDLVDEGGGRRPGEEDVAALAGASVAQVRHTLAMVPDWVGARW